MKTKQLFLALVATMLLGTAMPAQAQKRVVKRTPRTTATTTRTGRPTTQSKRPAATINKKCVIYDVEDEMRAWFIAKDYIYYVERNDNNAVMRIDKKTGERSTYISGIQGVYEGARPTIRDFNISGGREFLTLSKKGSSENNGVVIYNGRDVKTSPYMKNEVKSVLYSCDDYLVTYNGAKYSNNTISYWNNDLKITKTLNYWSESTGSPIYNDGLWGPDGGFWSSNGLRITKRNPKDSKTYYWDLSKESYVVDYNSQNSSSLSIETMVTQGDYLYVACGRRVYRINMVQPKGFFEYAKVPPTMDYTFKHIWVDPKGNMLTSGGDHYRNGDRNTLFWEVGNFENPRPLGNQLKTGFNKFGYTEVWLDLMGSFYSDHKTYADTDGNFVILTGSEIYIYNPNGVVGYTNTVGKIIE